MIKKFSSLVQLITYFDTEEKCLDHFSSLRWKDGKYCPHCGHKKVYSFKDGKLHKCGLCRKKFTVTVGTIFHGSRLPLKKWFIALHLATSHKKGISSCQLARDIDVTQKTAWHMLHRIRNAIEKRPLDKHLDGDVEVDETFVGGKEKNKHANKKNYSYWDSATKR